MLSPSSERSSKKSWYRRPEQPPGCTAIRRARSVRPSCSSRALTLAAATSVSCIPVTVVSFWTVIAVRLLAGRRRVLVGTRSRYTLIPMVTHRADSDSSVGVEASLDPRPGRRRSRCRLAHGLRRRLQRRLGPDQLGQADHFVQPHHCGLAAAELAVTDDR